MNIQTLITQTKTANPSATAQQIFDIINTPRTAPNAVPKAQVFPTLDITEKAALIDPAQRVVIENQLSGTWKSLLSNFASGKFTDVVNNVENLIASGLLTPETIAVFQETLVEASTPVPDPNWQATVNQPLWADYGLSAVMIGDCVNK